MNCDGGLFSKDEYVWLMVRDQSFITTPAYVALKTGLAEKYDLDLEIFIENDFKNGLNCDYDILDRL